jgi:hypothetical protein
VTKKKSTVPVFLIYAGIIHAIGLALLMPMLITLPGPGIELAPRTASVDVEIVPMSPSDTGGDQTSALPSASPAEADDAPVEAESADEPPKAVANVSPEIEPDAAEERAAQETAQPERAEPAKAAPKAVKKPVAQRGRKPTIRRSAKAYSKGPFNGAFSGLFSPPARRR